MPSPDSYRGKYRESDPEMMMKYVEEVRKVVGKCISEGKKVRKVFFMSLSLKTHSYFFHFCDCDCYHGYSVIRFEAFAVDLTFYIISSVV